MATSGAAGCVVNPALPNGEREFPDQVTKIYFDRPTMTSEKAASRAVAVNEKVGKMGFERLVFPYKNKLKMENIPTKTNSDCMLGARVAGRTIGVTRSPNLGIDFYQLFDIFTNSQSPGQEEATATMDRVRTLPFETIMKGIGEMLKALVILNTNKKIHKDVRLENMMFNPTTGIIKLIDFDEMIDMDREMIDDWKIPSRLMTAFPPEMALWNSKDSNAFDVSVNKKIDYLLDPKTSFTKCTKKAEKLEIIDLFTLRLTTWKRQLGVLTDMYKTQNTRKSIAYLFELSKNTPGPLAEYLLTEMGKSMDKMTEEKILDINERRFRMKNKSADTVDSYCMSYCLMVFLGMYLDDAKWAAHGATLDKLFKNVLIPLYKFNVYYDKDAPLKERLLSRVGIMNVLDDCSELFPDSFPRAVGRSSTSSRGKSTEPSSSAAVGRSRAPSRGESSAAGRSRTPSRVESTASRAVGRSRTPSRGIASRLETSSHSKRGNDAAGRGTSRAKRDDEGRNHRGGGTRKKMNSLRRTKRVRRRA